ncbi:hypothetical protein DL96DRAFT_1463978 [Flagelloscypha sp. PMI_526]|nr:hypothetical protein DL96DRAFT_1463978 [Flagelloscypha sp. PMI_526]
MFSLTSTTRSYILNANFQVHPNLHYIAHLPGNASGEQFLSQILRHIPSKTQFIWSQGRVPMSLILGRDIWNRCSAATHHTIRSRLSVVAQATCDLRVPIPPSFFDNAEEVFFPPQFVRARTTKGRMTANGEHQKVSTGPSRPLVIEPQDMPIWDFILRRLFVTPAMPLEKALPQLAPGARNLLDKLSGPTVAEEDRVAIKKKPRDLNIEEVHRIVRAFKNWPFAPKDLAVDKEFVPISPSCNIDYSPYFFPPFFVNSILI